VDYGTSRAEDEQQGHEQISLEGCSNGRLALFSSNRHSPEESPTSNRAAVFISKVLLKSTTGLVGLCVIATLGGCTSGRETAEPAVPTEEESASIEASIEETAEPEESQETNTAPGFTVLSDLESTLNHQWVNSDGYSYETGVRQVQTMASVDIANAKPGEAEVTWDYIMSGYVTNTTASRIAPVPAVDVIPAWPATSALCSLEDQYFTVDSAPVYLQGSDASLQVCTVGTFRLTGIGGETSIPDAGVLLIGGRFAATDNVVRTKVLTVPENLSEQIALELENPASLILAHEEGADAPDGRCRSRVAGLDVAKTTSDIGCPSL
jgi:hypothetical protein